MESLMSIAISTQDSWLSRVGPINEGLENQAEQVELYVVGSGKLSTFKQESDFIKVIYLGKHKMWGELEGGKS